MTTMLPRPPSIEDKVLAAVDGQWRTAREIHDLIGEDARTTVRERLTNLAAAGRVMRRYDPHPSGIIARYRRADAAISEP